MKTIYIIFFLAFFIACGSYGSDAIIIGRCTHTSCQDKCMRELKPGKCKISIIKRNPTNIKVECVCLDVDIKEFRRTSEKPGEF
uniref:Lipoprotein n=1 Tax=Strongyloides venezuelensis TaxID=75913 RepID=A0A0K0G0U8_STRVS